MERAEWVDAMLEPDASDEMGFVLQAPDDDLERSFSMEGLDTITNSIREFVMARIVGYHTRTGQVPKNLHATVKLDWVETPDSLMEVLPRPWAAFKDTGMTPVDGGTRARAVEG